MKSACVTGARQGLGGGFVDVLLARGYEVFAGTRVLTGDLPQRDALHWIALDVNDNASIAHAAHEVAAKTESLDLLINNAGVNKDTATNNHKELVTKLDALDREAMLGMFQTNTLGPLFVTKAFLSLLKASPSFVINLSSCRASFHDEEGNETGNYGYRASKVALNMLTLCSLMDLPVTVKTFAVHPGSVKSLMNPSGTMSPVDQATKILAITERWNDALNGRFLRADGSLYPL